MGYRDNTGHGGVERAEEVPLPGASSRALMVPPTWNGMRGVEPGGPYYAVPSLAGVPPTVSEAMPKMALGAIIGGLWKGKTGAAVGAALGYLWARMAAPPVPVVVVAPAPEQPPK